MKAMTWDDLTDRQKLRWRSVVQLSPVDHPENEPPYRARLVCGLSGDDLYAAFAREVLGHQVLRIRPGGEGDYQWLERVLEDPAGMWVGGWTRVVIPRMKTVTDSLERADDLRIIGNSLNAGAPMKYEARVTWNNRPISSGGKDLGEALMRLAVLLERAIEASGDEEMEEPADGVIATFQLHDGWERDVEGIVAWLHDMAEFVEEEHEDILAGFTGRFWQKAHEDPDG